MNDQKADSKSETQEPAAPSPPSAGGKSHRDRYIKLGFLAVALIIVGWLAVRQYFGVDPPGFIPDLDAALTQARDEGRGLLVLVHDRPPSNDFDGLKTMLGTPGNKKAMANANVIKVSTYLKRGGDMWEKYGIKIYPTLLLLASDGTRIASHAGYMAEVGFPSFVYQAVKLLGWHTNLAVARKQAKDSGRNLLVVLYDKPGDGEFGLLKVYLNRPVFAEAIDEAGVATAVVRWDPKDTSIKGINAKVLPALLLLGSDGKEITRRAVAVIGEAMAKKTFEADFREKFLKGEKAD